jgi:hypothetical protein
MLKLRLVTLRQLPLYTEGILINDSTGRKICDTLEDQVRYHYQEEAIQRPDWKVPGETAIPPGTYCLTLHLSPSFHKHLLLLQDVPLFRYILIHYGALPGNTKGCVLVGERNAPGSLSNTGMTDHLVDLFRMNNSKGVIEITR